MEKEKIIQELQKHDSTILNFPDRGPWGSSSYRGNCSGWIHAFLVWKYQVTKMAELFAGSGTGYDVAKDMGIAYSGADLNPIPCFLNVLILQRCSPLSQTLDVPLPEVWMVAAVVQFPSGKE